MSKPAPFRLYRHDLDGPRRDDGPGLDDRILPEDLGNHLAGASGFVADEDLEAAINTALAVGAPLLLTGEPGTGKTQVAFHIAWHFGLDLKEDVFELFVRSTTVAKDLLYDFDAVAYFREAQGPAADRPAAARGTYVNEGPLWKAYKRGKPTVVLIDEVDKAPRDFPNDLLNVLDQHRFYVPERDEWVERSGLPPIVVITSNSERRLPEPFLRRCIFHHIAFDHGLVERAVNARRKAFEGLKQDFLDVALRRFWEIRDTGIRKKPATGELLVWLTVLHARGDVTTAELDRLPLSKLPALAALVKDRDDLAQL